ncbi:hypothetical protein Daura_37640 [Dactylosporangium aurantiacum]|uniref:Uncharacterized protein n=1 Tax=Dactylosporangium aurantiacum TaxID=35754 RepID=A0A9Q9IE27_9ACTN|nr:hypothetical protein [Dactylosporangium aurantiacum]MDG6101858.1 hypothetical protein [Dactylosporangium aurantiacum]UWZ52342.1 hypothetical protein Daura_37640 [Dactylosporangium aurantiacum]
MSGYLALETRRALRNPRYLLLAVALPAVLFLGQFARAGNLAAVSNGVMGVGAPLGGLLVPFVLFPAPLVGPATDLGRALPTYWLGEVGRGAVDGHTDAGNAALVLAAWTLEAAAVVALRQWRTTRRR